MSDNLPTFYVKQFSTNVQLLLQQKGSRLRSAVMSGTHVGSQASPVDQIAPVGANKVVSRFAAMPRIDALLDRRWAFPVDYDLNQMIDSFDKLRILTDPSSHYVTNAVYALGRSMDQEIINAFFGNAFTGVDGTTSTSFTAGNKISVQQGSASPSGLSVAKLRQAKLKLMQNYVDLDSDPIYCAITAQQHDDLLAEVQVIDNDYNGGKPVLEEGRISRFLGINFIHTELLGTGTDDQAGTSTLVPVWAKSGMYMGMWNDIQTDISQRKDIQGLPYQAYAKATFGGARLDEKRVMMVYCR
jgi:hypothetical protein